MNFKNRLQEKSGMKKIVIIKLLSYICLSLTLHIYFKIAISLVKHHIMAG